LPGGNTTGRVVEWGVRVRYTGVLIGVVVLALLLSLGLAWQRHRLEASNKRVEVAVNWAEVVALAERVGEDPFDLLLRFKAAGATAVLLKEQNLGDLENRLVWVKGGNELIAEGFRGGAKLEPMYTYIITRDRALWKRLVYHLENKVPRGMPVDSRDLGEVFVVGMPLVKGDLGLFPLGFNPAGLQAAVEAGMGIIPQLRSWPQVRQDSLAAALAPLADYADHISLFLFNDGLLPGFPNPAATRWMADELKGLGNPPVGIIEFTNQKGLPELVRFTGKNAIRLHSIGERMGSISPQAAVDQFALAASERNIRAVFARFFFRWDNPDWIGSNLAYVTKVTQALEDKGLSTGRPVPFGSLQGSRLVLLVIGWGVVAAGMLLLELMGLRRVAVVLGTLVALLWTVAVLVNQLEPARKLMALGAALVLPTLGVVAMAGVRTTGTRGAVTALWVTSLVSLAGALLVVGLLWDVNYMLKLEEFRGVKVAHLLPLLMVAFILGAWPMRERWPGWVVSGLSRPLNLALVLGVVAVAAVVYVYLARTGNDAPGLSTAMEKQVRYLLGQWLEVRPRTKEFLVGHPFLVLAFYLGYRHRLLPLFVVGAVGQVSIVNTFAHLHTPLAVSMVRTFHALWLGSLAGMVLIMIYHLGLAAYTRYGPGLWERYHYE